MLKQYEIPDCPIETTLTLLGDRTGILIIYNLLSGPKRLSELSKSITSVSKKMITQRLRILEETGLITRTIFPEVPSRVEYNLTEVGKTFEPILELMTYLGNEEEFTPVPHNCIAVFEYYNGKLKLRGLQKDM